MISAMHQRPDTGKKIHDEAVALIRTLRAWAISCSPEGPAYRRIKPIEEALYDAQALAKELGHDTSPKMKGGRSSV
jgi:hypothetical protein